MIQCEYQVLANPQRTCQEARGQISWMRGGNERETDDSFVSNGTKHGRVQVNTKKPPKKQQDKQHFGLMRGGHRKSELAVHIHPFDVDPR